MTHLRIAFSLILAAAIGALSAQTLTVKKEKDKYGFADETGKMVIKAKYNQAYPFENGRAKVCKGDNWGFIDATGKEIIPIQYASISAFENGLASVKKGNKYGYIKEDGTIYIKPEYDFIGTPNEDGWVWVGKGKTLEASQKGLYHHDKLVVKPGPFYLGFYFPTDSIDYTDGRPVDYVGDAPKNYEIKSNFCRLSRSTEPYIWVTSVYKTGILDLDGNKVIVPPAGCIGMPKDGYALVRKHSTKKKKDYYEYNYLSADGKSKKLFKKDVCQEVDPDNVYETCMPFNNGKAMCGDHNLAYIIDTQGNTVTEMYDRLMPVGKLGFISVKGSRYGLLSAEGKENVAPTYKLILAPFEGSEVLPAQEEASGNFGFIDFSGKQIVPFRFQDATAFSDGKGYVKENGFYGIVDPVGNYIVRNRWQSILPASIAGCDYVWVQSPDTSKWHCLSISRDALSFDTGFDGANSFDAKNRALVLANDKIGAVAADGSMVLPVKFSSVDLANAALLYIDGKGLSSMSDTEAYRFNIYNNNNRHKYRLSQVVDEEMWDY